MVFPYGRPYAYPCDRLEHPLALAMMTPSNFRSYWMKYYFLGDPQKNPVAQLEETLSHLIQVEPLLLKLDKAQKSGTISRGLRFSESVAHALQQTIITEAEAESLLRFEQEKSEAVRVDAFSQETLDRKHHGH